MHQKKLSKKQLRHQKGSVSINKEVILSMQTEAMKSQIEKIAQLHQISSSSFNLNF